MQATGDLVDRLVQLGETDPDRVLFIELLDGINESATLTAGQLLWSGRWPWPPGCASGACRPARSPSTYTPPRSTSSSASSAPVGRRDRCPDLVPPPAEHLESRLAPVRRTPAPPPSSPACRRTTARSRSSPWAHRRRPAGGHHRLRRRRGAEPAPADGRDIAYLQYTSGSDQRPQGRDRHPRQPGAQPRPRAWPCWATTTTRSPCSWCPLTHDMGLGDGGPAVDRHRGHHRS